MQKIIPVLLLSLSSQIAWGADVYKYWDWGNSPARENYEYALLTMALEASAETYGPYTLARVRKELSTNRVRREINAGNIINVRSGPYLRLSNIENPEEVNLPVTVPIMQNLLGYRRLVVHKENVDTLSHIRKRDDLTQFSVGLARGWVDVDIFRANNIKVDDSANVATLIDMLELKRFDFFPASIVGLETVLDRASEQGDLVAIPDLVVVYPFPVVFYVPKAKPRLAERLQFGLQVLTDSGEVAQLLQRHFIQELNYLHSENVHFITLSNPLLPGDLQMSHLPFYPKD
ncbi:transporter substrate-binding domain-containing protein [Gilvimarinus sp. SDUM040013]|uniref:Transporter substrate-binding domain-containing protein n=1 Tax=Gilvimarinus gilvus TaxID=3058038 RepID=A0ABU4RU77_9GAMM|nr:transporter substrate-binding domain-containing protein [Gilvimarinus sp. SDUM040013]MDO3388256.1 transporter substrate-binding domain-containing protein [Gilvimarinus sp. SDUM040013]MDX6847806.1 transporter substrate-binding domain-containing protein [Gilvimarinus sp. SDUM040013]